MYKQIITTLVLTITSMLSQAEIPKQFNVYVSGFGISIPFCRGMIDEYNKVFNSQVTLVVKPGASGLFATLEMVQDKNFSVQCFPGTSELVLNRKQFPNHDYEYDQVTMVTIVAESPVMFSTRLANAFNSLPELISSKKSLAVGHHTSFGLLIASKIFNNDTVFVNFKSATDAIPSLLDGSLDVYIDSGGLSPYIVSGMLKSLGTINGSSNSLGVNLNSNYPNVLVYKPMAAMATSKNNNPKDIEELNRRLSVILKDEKFVNMIKGINNNPVFKSVKESNDIVDAMKKDLLSNK